MPTRSVLRAQVAAELCSEMESLWPRTRGHISMTAELADEYNLNESNIKKLMNNVLDIVEADDRYTPPGVKIPDVKQAEANSFLSKSLSDVANFLTDKKIKPALSDAGVVFQ